MPCQCGFTNFRKRGECKQCRAGEALLGSGRRADLLCKAGQQISSLFLCITQVVGSIGYVSLAVI